MKKRVLCIVITGILLTALLSGCSVKDVVAPVRDYFAKEASLQEETASTSQEDTLLSFRVKDGQGQPITDASGEPVTVLSLREHATGGEPRINSRGVPQIHPVGEIMTHAPGTPVLDAAGNPETYAGGEPVLDVLGFQAKDSEGQPATRAAGEPVTHDSDDIVYDADGEPVRYNGEPQTYAEGETMYDTNGEVVTFPVAVQRDLEGNPMIEENGDLVLSEVELMTDDSGSPYLDENGELATKQLDPVPPTLTYDPVIEEGYYYLRNSQSNYIFFAVDDPQQDSSTLHMEFLNDALPRFELRYDLEGYAIFILEGTNLALTLQEPSENSRIVLQEMARTPYPQYKYWDDPKFTVAESQKWILRDEGEDNFTIRSAMADNFVMTVDDTAGLENAPLKIGKFEGKEQQLFQGKRDTPAIERYIEEGDYYIRSGLTNWMLISLGDGNYSEGRESYIYFSDQGDGQKFHISYDEQGFAIISHGDSDMVLSVSGANPKDYQPVAQYTYDGGAWQKWILEPNPEDDEGYYIRSALNPSQVMNLQNGDPRNETPIHMAKNNNTYQQYWFFEKEAIPSGYSYESMDEYAQNFNSMTDYLILVNSLTNHVGVYQGEKGNWENLFYWDCVTGKSTTPTVKGEFTIYRTLPSFDGNSDSPVWYTVYYASNFYPFYYFHSIIYYQGTMDIMDASMGYNGSHGCVRLWIDNAKWIYENIPIDTRVVSY